MDPGLVSLFVCLSLPFPSFPCACWRSPASALGCTPTVGALPAASTRFLFTLRGMRLARLRDEGAGRPIDDAVGAVVQLREVEKQASRRV